MHPLNELHLFFIAVFCNFGDCFFFVLSYYTFFYFSLQQFSQTYLKKSAFSINKSKSGKFLPVSRT